MNEGNDLDIQFTMPYPKVNGGTVKKIIDKFANRLWELQSESHEENLNIVAGLKAIIKYLEQEFADDVN